MDFENDVSLKQFENEPTLQLTESEEKVKSGWVFDNHVCNCSE